MLVRDGTITSDRSLESPLKALSDELTLTYGPRRDGSIGSTPELVGRGFWLSCNVEQDVYTPEDMFKDAPLTQYIP